MIFFVPPACHPSFIISKDLACSTDCTNNSLIDRARNSSKRDELRPLPNRCVSEQSDLDTMFESRTNAESPQLQNRDSHVDAWGDVCWFVFFSVGGVGGGVSPFWTDTEDQETAAPFVNTKVISEHHLSLVDKFKYTRFGIRAGKKLVSFPTSIACSIC